MQQKVAVTQSNAAASTQRFNQVHQYLSSQLAKPVQPSLDTRARHDFFAHYVLRESAAYDMLGSIFKNSKPGDHLSASVDAASLAFLASKSNNQPHVTKLATKAYVDALQALAPVITDPAAATSDATVQSILLLDLYEKMTNRSSLTEDTVRTHLTGALTLIEKRGAANTESVTARRLVERLYITTILSCAAAGSRVPQNVQDLRHVLDPFFDHTDLKWILIKLNIEAITFSADVRSGKIRGPENVIPQAEMMDRQLASMETALSPDWKPNRIFVTQGQDRRIFGKYYDVYISHEKTHIRNMVRTLRLHLHAMMQGFARAAPHLLDPKSPAIVDACADQIAASVPQFLIPGVRPDNREPFSSVQMLQCYTLLPQMYLAGRLTSNKALSEWVFDMMEHMANVGAMKMAKVTVDTLRTDKSIAYWDIYALLGGYAFVI